LHSVGPANFEWIVEHVADMAIAKARTAPQVPELRWSAFLGAAAAPAKAAKKPAKKKSASKKTETAKAAKGADNDGKREAGKGEGGKEQEAG
jgi:hypothetical protein